MAKKQTKKSKGAKPKENRFFSSVPKYRLERILEESNKKHIFSNDMMPTPAIVGVGGPSPQNMIDISVFTPQLMRLCSLIGRINNGSFMLNEDKLVHDGSVYSLRMCGKSKYSINEYMDELIKNVKRGKTYQRFNAALEECFRENLSKYDDVTEAFRNTSLVMTLFSRFILNELFRVLSRIIYKIMYDDYPSIVLSDIANAFNYGDTLYDTICNNKKLVDIISSESDLYGSITLDMFKIVAEKWTQTIDEESCDDIIKELGVGVSWRTFDILGILPEVVTALRHYHSYVTRSHNYSGLSPEIEIAKHRNPKLKGEGWSSMFNLQYAIFDKSDMSIDESLFNLSWNTAIESTLKNGKSNLSIRFISDKFKYTLVGNYNYVKSNVVDEWSIPGPIKCVFPTQICLNPECSVLLADTFEFEVIYKGNSDKLNDYMFDQDNKLLRGFSSIEYDKVYEHVARRGNAMVICYGDFRIIITNESIITNLTDSSYNATAIEIFDFGKITQCIAAAHNYLKSKESDGSIDFYFEESEEVVHQSTKRSQIIHRRGSFVRGHYRHYKSGVVTLVRPHVRKGTNYIGEYVLEI